MRRIFTLSIFVSTSLLWIIGAGSTQAVSFRDWMSKFQQLESGSSIKNEVRVESSTGGNSASNGGSVKTGAAKAEVHVEHTGAGATKVEVKVNGESVVATTTKSNVNVKVIASSTNRSVIQTTDRTVGGGIDAKDAAGSEAGVQSGKNRLVNIFRERNLLGQVRHVFQTLYNYVFSTF